MAFNCVLGDDGLDGHLGSSCTDMFLTFQEITDVQIYRNYHFSSNLFSTEAVIFQAIYFKTLWISFSYDHLPLISGETFCPGCRTKTISMGVRHWLLRKSLYLGLVNVSNFHTIISHWFQGRPFVPDAGLRQSPWVWEIDFCVNPCIWDMSAFQCNPYIWE